MKVFSEQYNGDCKTDLASAFADVTLTVESQPDEQFTLAPGGRYYFDLPAMDISGTVNSNLPDSTLHYVPFTYVGTVNAYKLTSEMATTEEYAQKNKYPHSLFIADYAVTHTVSWDNLNTAGLIFGKDYAAGGVDYTLRAPSVGSSYTGSGDSERGTPKSNEWDKILDKDDGYIKNWREMLSCGQDTTIRISASFRAVRGWKRSARFWTSYNTSYSTFGFRPVLEVLNPDTLGSDGLKVVTLDLGGGTLGNSIGAITQTTNYDLFLENNFGKDHFQPYIGQNELLFSTIYEVAEIYKIHGCCSKPDSIVINSHDYDLFVRKSAYLSSKILTLFLERPIIFLGYSVSDPNIRRILRSISECLENSQLEQLKKRLIFIEWTEDSEEEGISERQFDFDNGKTIIMENIKLFDYSILYSAILDNTVKYDVKALRRIKSQLYELVKTNKPTEKLYVATNIEDDS